MNEKGEGDRHTVEEFKDLRLMMIGDLMVDKYVWGETIRLSHEAPVPVLKVTSEDYEPGGAANVAQISVSLGARTYLCGLVGFDDAAFNFRKMLHSTGINTGGVFPSESRPTTQKIRVMSAIDNYLVCRYDYESNHPASENEQAGMLKYVESYLSEIDAVFIYDCGKGVFSDSNFCGVLTDKLRKRKIPLIVKSIPIHFNRFINVDLIILTHKEAQDFLYFSKKTAEKEMRKLGRMLQQEFGQSDILIYRESLSEGIEILFQTEERQYIFQERRRFADITGVLDGMCAATTCAVGGKMNAEMIHAFAVKTAMVLRSKPGASLITPEELKINGNL